MPSDRDLAPRRPHSPDHTIQQRALAGPVRTQQDIPLARRQAERDVFEHHSRAIGGIHRSNFKRGTTHERFTRGKNAMPSIVAAALASARIAATMAAPTFETRNKGSNRPAKA